MNITILRLKITTLTGKFTIVTLHPPNQIAGIFLLVFWNIIIVYNLDDEREQSLLGKDDALALGIVRLQPEEAANEVSEYVEISQSITSVKLTPIPTEGISSGGQTQEKIDKAMKDLTDQISKTLRR